MLALPEELLVPVPVTSAGVVVVVVVVTEADCVISASMMFPCSSRTL